MITKWRSPDWQNPYGKPRMGKKASRWYELGADPMLEVLRKEEIPPETFAIFLRNSYITTADVRQRGITYQGIKGKIFFIPDDPQPIEKFEQFSIPEKLDNSKPCDVYLPDKLEPQEVKTE